MSQDALRLFIADLREAMLGITGRLLVSSDIDTVLGVAEDEAGQLAVKMQSKGWGINKTNPSTKPEL